MSAMTPRHVLGRAGLSASIIRPKGASMLQQSYRLSSTRPPSSTDPSNYPPPPPTGPTTTTTRPPTPASKVGKYSLINKYSHRLGQVSKRTGVPLPSLGISFLILHELTAILPIVVIFILLQTLGAGKALSDWILHTAELDSPALAQAGDGEEGGEGWRGVVRGWYEEGVVRVEKVGKRYGILGYEKVDRSANRSADPGSPTSPTVPTSSSSSTAPASSSLASVTGPTDTVVGVPAAEQVANAISAYVIVKALLPLRIAFSIGAAPAFARFALNPVQRLFSRFRRS